MENYFMLLHCFPLNLNELKLSKRKKPVCPCALAPLQVFSSLGWLVVIVEDSTALEGGIHKT